MKSIKNKQKFLPRRLLLRRLITKALTIIGASLILVSQFGDSLAAPPEYPADFVKRQQKLSANAPYQYVFGTNGINCDVGEHISDLRPRLGNDGHVGCPCLTDMGCAMVNPQYTDESGKVDAKVVAKAPKGSTCSNPLPWEEARQNVGRTLVVVGPVVNVTTDATRKPSKATWINVGERFPNVNRLTLVIWNNASFKLQQPKQLEGKLICVVGKISSYRGSPQIVIRSAEEFRVSQ